MVLLALLAGCVTDRNDWFRERDHVLCELYVDCFAMYADEAACVEDVASFVNPACDGFSAAAAQDCVSALRTQAEACPTNDVDAWEIPAVCADVCEPPGE